MVHSQRVSDFNEYVIAPISKDMKGNNGYSD